MASQAIEPAAAQVPDLVRTPALTITADDIVLPRIYVGHFSSKAVQSGLVKPGAVYAAPSADDPDPQVIYEPGGEGVLFYVLGMRKGKSVIEGGELVLYDFDDVSAPEDAWVTYNYTILVPDVDLEVPCKLLLTRTGRQTALKINTVLKKHSITGPSWSVAFKLTTTPKENEKGKWFVAQAAQAETDPAHIAAAEAIAPALSAAAPTGDFGSTGEQPAI